MDKKKVAILVIGVITCVSGLVIAKIIKDKNLVSLEDFEAEDFE